MALANDSNVTPTSSNTVEKSTRRRTRNAHNDIAGKLQFKLTYMHVEDHKSPIYCIQFNYFIKDISVFACVGSNRICIYECLLDGKLKFLQVYADPEEEEQFFTCAWSYCDEAFDPVLAVAGKRGIIRIIKSKTMACVESFIGHGGEINEVKFHPSDSNLLISGSKDYTVRMWNIKTSVCVAIFGGVEGHRDGVLSVDFNMDGDKFVSCGLDHAIKFWHLDKKGIRESIEKSYAFDIKRSSVSFKTYLENYPDFSTRDVHSNYTDCIRWFGYFLISKSNDNLLKLWKPNFANGSTLCHDIECENCDLWFLKFSMNFSQQILALGNRSGKIFVWNLKIADPTLIPCTTLSHIRCTTTIRHTGLNRDGYILIGVGDDGSIWRWDRIIT